MLPRHVSLTLAAIFFVASMTGVHRSLYGMRIGSVPGAKTPAH
jgi:hypothetical protein